MAGLERAVRHGQVSRRGAERALRVAWTIADLRGAAAPGAQDVSAALTFREQGAP
jgi:magnesium chelatase family protein